MTDQWDSTSQQQAGPRVTRVRWATDTYQRWQTSPTWAQRLVGALFLLLLVGFATILLLSGIVVGAIAAGVIALIWGVGWIVKRIRAAIGTSPHSSGGDDFRDRGRENVRVIGPTDRR